MTELTGAQVRMARAFLRWTIADLAKRAAVGISTVQAIEATDGSPQIGAGGIDQTREHREAARAASVEAVRKALIAAGLTLLPDDGKGGVGVRGRLEKIDAVQAVAKIGVRKTPPRGVRKKGRG